jgi:iron complex outermembrane receptor protein
LLVGGEKTPGKGRDDMGNGIGRGALLASVAIVCVAAASPASAQSKMFEVPAQEATSGIAELGRQADIQIVAARRYTQNKRTNAVRGTMTVDRALVVLLDGTGLVARRTGAQTYSVIPSAPAAKPREGNAPPPAAANSTIEGDAEIIVTAQKKEEKITDVPIAMTALSSQALDDRKIEGGSELLRAIPNVNFSKTNFSMYNFQIRGVGTQSISASSDPAVAVSFNSTPLVRNRLFESEFFDMERIEVLRGPQGTLYGRNATAGVVNMIPALPDASGFAGEVKGEVGNFSTTRLSGMLNVPLSDTLAVRVAGAMTKRDGFDYNSFTQQRVNGRDLWSTHASLAWEPSDRFRANVIWQHFEEDDDRLRTGKQLCTKDPGPTSFGGRDISADLRFRGILSQGCLPGSIYDDAAYSVPNAFALPHVAAAAIISSLGNSGPRGPVMRLIDGSRDPYADVVQSRDLRKIATSIDPVFRAKNDVFQLNV